MSFVSIHARHKTLDRSKLINVDNRKAYQTDIVKCLSSFDWIIISVLTVITAVTRLFFIGQPMRYDESFTYLMFVDKGFKDLFYYPLPNNHILHTLLVEASVVIGGSSPESIRIPALLAGIALTPMIFAVCRQIIPERSGLFAASAICVSPYFTLYSTNARGYTLLLLIMLAIFFVSLRHLNSWDFNIKHLALISLLCALALFTMPSALMAITGILLWLTCSMVALGYPSKEALKKVLIPIVLLAGILTFLLYLPSIIITGGVEPIINNRFVTSSPWEVFLNKALPHLVEIYSLWSRDVPSAIIVLTAFFCFAGLLYAWKYRNYPLLILLPSILAASLLILVFKHRIPYARTWIFLLPPILILADAGFSFFLKKLPTVFRSAILGLLLPGVLYASYSLVSDNTISKYPDTGAFPEASLIATRLNEIGGPNDKITAKTPADFPLYYYLKRYNYPNLSETTSHRTPETFIVVSNQHYKLEDITGDPVEKLFTINNATLYRVTRTPQ